MKISYGKCALRMAFQIIVFSMFILGNADASRQVLDSDGMNYAGIWNESDISYVQDSNLNYGIQSVDPQAIFSLRIGSGVKSNNDRITSGWHSMGQGYSMSIENVNDTTNTVLGNLQYTLQADNISSVSYPEYANWNSSYASWYFPENFSLDEGAWLLVDAGKGILNGYLHISISRKLNKSIFLEDGYQIAEFNFTFDDKNFTPSGGTIQTPEISSMNASFLLGTFYTDAPINENRPFPMKNEHRIDFLFNTTKLIDKKTYNLSVVVKVDLKNNNSVLFKPYYGLWYIYNRTQIPDQIGNTATISNEMPTADVHYASVSTNISNRWIITQYNICSAGLDGIIQNPYQFISDLKIEPTVSINSSNPVKASAVVSGDNLSSVNFGIVDIKNLLSDNMTLLGVDINSSGFNGKYSARWHANSFSIKKGNTQEIVTAGIFDRSNLLDHYGVIGFFKKNDTTDEGNAIMWFDRTSGILSKISKYDEAFSPLSIENGSSEFKVSKIKFIKGTENPPSSINGSTYALFTIGSSNNPSLVSSSVPDGIYRAFIRVMDKIGNNQGEFMDVEVSGNTPSAVVSLPCEVCKVPTDTDGDGLYEDINGNSRKDFNDIVLFFNYLEWIAGNEPNECFDCNGNGRIDFNDIICLFNKL